MESGDVDNYFMLDMAGAPEEGEEELEQTQEGQDAEAEADLGWAVDTAADSRDVAADIGDTDFEEYAADLEAQAQLQMEAEVDAQAELALAEEDARAQELAQEAAAVAAAFGVEDEVPNFAMEFAPENGTPVHMQQEALDFEAAGEAELGEEEAPEQADTEEVAEADAEMQEDEADRADEAGDSAAVSLQPSRKRSRDAAFAEAQELLATVTPAALLGKLRRLDPVAGIDEYYLVDGELEGQALAEDFQLTRDFYSAQALENSLVSMRAAVQRVQSRVKIPENSSIIEVLPGRLTCSCLGRCLVAHPT
ncbi:ANK3 [Symbiodinium sp. CCMP2592]|nr:ANK3 [Symbiodinium sp. CCMP2592]